MSKCIYCGHDDEECANVRPITEDHILRIRQRVADNCAVDSGVKEVYQLIKANLVNREKETLKTLLYIVDSNSKATELVLESLNYFDGTGGDIINDSYWKKDIVTYGLYNTSHYVRDSAMQLVEKWPKECIDVLRNHIEKVDYLRDYQKNIITLYDQGEYE